MFNVIIFFAGAALMLVMAVRASRARLAPVNKGVKVQAGGGGPPPSGGGGTLFPAPEGCAQALYFARTQYPPGRPIRGARRFGGKHRQNIRPGGRLSLDLQRIISTLRLHAGDLLSQFAVDLCHRLGGRDGSGCFIRSGKKDPQR